MMIAVLGMFSPLSCLFCFAALDKTLFSSSHDCSFRVSFRSQWEFCINLAAEDISQSALFPEHELYGLEASLSWLSSALAATLESQVLVLMAFWMCVLFLRWLRVMVTLKVCVCCSSILSSSDTLMKGHQEKAWRKPARNLRKEDKRGFLLSSFGSMKDSGREHVSYLWFRQQ